MPPLEDGREVRIFPAGYWLIPAFMIFFTGGFTVFVRPVDTLLWDGDAKAGTGYLQVIFLIGHLLISAPLFLGPSRIKSLIGSIPISWAGMLIFPILASLWSLDPGTSFRRGIGLSLTIWSGIALSALYERRTMERIMLTSLLLICAASIVTAFVVPKYGVHLVNGETCWRGIFPHKNSLGMTACLAGVIAASCFLDGRLCRIAVPLAAMSAVCLIGAKAATSLIAMIAGCSVLVLLRKMSGRWVLSISILCIVAAVIFQPLLELAYQQVVASLGKDTSLTGRADLWGACLTVAWEHFPLGTGLGAFWGTDLERQHAVFVQMHVAQAHDTWIELFMQLGLPGLAVVVFWIAVSGLRLVRQMDFAADSIKWPLAVVVASLVISATESATVSPHHYITLMLAYCLWKNTTGMDNEPAT